MKRGFPVRRLVAGLAILFLIDRKGVIAFSAVGAVTPERLRKEIPKVVK